MNVLCLMTLLFVVAFGEGKWAEPVPLNFPPHLIRRFLTSQAMYNLNSQNTNAWQRKASLQAPVSYPIEEKGEGDFVTKRTPSCISRSTHGTLCETDPEYAKSVKDLLDQLILKKGLEKSLKNPMINDVLDAPGNMLVVSRFGNNFFESSVCPSKEKVIYPQRGMTPKDEFVYILNHGHYKQGVRIEECKNETRTRFLGTGKCVSDEDGEKSECMQKFILKNMIALHPNGREMHSTSIIIPSCCACRTKRFH